LLIYEALSKIQSLGTVALCYIMWYSDIYCALGKITGSQSAVYKKYFDVC